jgi:hypothetical protein
MELSKQYGVTPNTASGEERNNLANLLAKMTGKDVSEFDGLDET